MQAGIILVNLVASLLAPLGWCAPAVFTFLLAVAASAQCDPGECADGPASYRLLDRARS